VRLLLAALLTLQPLAPALAQEADPLEDADLVESAAVQCAAADFDAADAEAEDAVAQEAAADDDASQSALSRSRQRLSRLAGVLEFYAHPSFAADPAMRQLISRAVPAEAAGYMTSRRRALEASYASLAVMDLYALREPMSCPSAGKTRWAMLQVPGLLTDAQGRPTAWLSFLYRASRASLQPAADAEQDAEAEDAAAEDAASYAAARGRVRLLSAKLEKARGAAAEPLLCARAQAYAELAAAHQAPAADAQADADAEDEAPARAGAQIFARTASAVVFIRAGSAGGRRAAAAGVVLDASGTGLVVTRARAVVDPATGKPFSPLRVHAMPAKLSGSLDKDLGAGVEASLVGADMGLDLALLRLSAKPAGLRALSPGDDSKAGAGDTVYALGHPEQGGWWSLTKGVIAGSRDNAGSVYGKDVFLTNAGLNRGNFGGPLLSAEGAWIGLVLPLTARLPDGRVVSAPDFALRSSALRRWLGRAADLEDAAVEETPAADEEALAAAAGDEDASDEPASSPSEEPAESEASALEASEAALVTVAQPYSMAELASVPEDEDSGDDYGFDAEQDSEAPAEEAGEAPAEEAGEAPAVAEAPVKRKATTVKERASDAFDELAAEEEKQGGGRSSDSEDVQSSEDPLEAAAVASRTSAPSRPAPAPSRPAPAPTRTAPAPTQTRPAPTQTRPAPAPTRPAPPKPAPAPPAAIKPPVTVRSGCVSAPRPAPKPVFKPTTPIPAPTRVPPVAPTSYTPRPTPPAPRPAPGGSVSRPAPRPSPAPAPNPGARRPSPVPMPTPAPRPPAPPPTPRGGSVVTTAPPPAPAPKTLGATAPATKLGGQMGRLTPFNHGGGNPGPLTGPMEKLKAGSELKNIKLPPPPTAPKAKCTNCAPAPVVPKPRTAPSPVTTAPRPPPVPVIAPTRTSRTYWGEGREKKGSVPAKKATTTPAPTAPAPAPAAAYAVPKYISIDEGGDVEYGKKVRRDLEKISKTKTGQALLKSLEASGMKITIKSDAARAIGNYAVAVTPWTAGPEPGVLEVTKAGTKAGPKADVEVGYSPDRTKLGIPGDDYSKTKWANPPNRPPDVGLFHELVHADDMMHGRLDTTLAPNKPPRDKSDVQTSELRAVGLVGKSPYSENAYRTELKLELRTFY
jgi:serine protease Do